MKRRQFLQTAGALGLLGLLTKIHPDTLAAVPGKSALSPQIQSARQNVMSRIEANRGISVPREDGQFLHLLALATQAQHALEIGTFMGYSAIWIASALEQTGGQLITIDIDPQRVIESKQNLAQAGLADRVTCLQGDAHQVAKTVPGPFDLVFLDADKGNEVDYFNTVFPKLRPGAFLVLHNAIQSKRVMQPYLDLVRDHPQLLSVVLSLTLKDGMSVSFKKRN